MSVIRAARLTAHLPRGSEIWKPLGGPQAVSDEWDLLRMIELNVRAIPWQFSDEKGRGPQPEPVEYPEPDEPYRDKPKSRRESPEDYTTRRALARKQQLEKQKQGE